MKPRACTKAQSAKPIAQHVQRIAGPTTRTRFTKYRLSCRRLATRGSPSLVRSHLFTITGHTNRQSSDNPDDPIPNSPAPPSPATCPTSRPNCFIRIDNSILHPTDGQAHLQPPPPDGTPNNLVLLERSEELALSEVEGTRFFGLVILSFAGCPILARSLR